MSKDLSCFWILRFKDGHFSVFEVDDLLWLECFLSVIVKVINIILGNFFGIKVVTWLVEVLVSEVSRVFATKEVPGQTGLVAFQWESVVILFMDAIELFFTDLLCD
jgi:hypothetical protein